MKIMDKLTCGGLVRAFDKVSLLCLFGAGVILFTVVSIESFVGVPEILEYKNRNLLQFPIYGFLYVFFNFVFIIPYSLRVLLNCSVPVIVWFESFNFRSSLWQYHQIETFGYKICGLCCLLALIGSVGSADYSVYRRRLSCYGGLFMSHCKVLNVLSISLSPVIIVGALQNLWILFAALLPFAIIAVVAKYKSYRLGEIVFGIFVAVVICIVELIVAILMSDKTLADNLAPLCLCVYLGVMAIVVWFTVLRHSAEPVPLNNCKKESIGAYPRIPMNTAFTYLAAMVLWITCVDTDMAVISGSHADLKDGFRQFINKMTFFVILGMFFNFSSIFGFRNMARLRTWVNVMMLEVSIIICFIQRYSFFQDTIIQNSPNVYWKIVCVLTVLLLIVVNIGEVDVNRYRRVFKNRGQRLSMNWRFIVVSVFMATTAIGCVFAFKDLCWQSWCAMLPGFIIILLCLSGIPRQSNLICLPHIIKGAIATAICLLMPLCVAQILVASAINQLSYDWVNISVLVYWLFCVCVLWTAVKKIKPKSVNDSTYDLGV